MKALTVVLLDAEDDGILRESARSGLNRAVSYCPDYEETVWQSKSSGLKPS